jgi:hypothetical protein
MLKIAMVVVGLFFVAAILPVVGGIRDPAHSDTGDTMMMSMYFVLGLFLLVGARNPSAHRSLIAFAAWANIAHAITMGTLGFEMPAMRDGFVGASILLVAISGALLALNTRTAEGRPAPADTSRSTARSHARHDEYSAEESSRS